MLTNKGEGWRAWRNKRVRKYAHTRTHARTHTRTQTCKHTHTRTQTCTHTHTHTHTHTQQPPVESNSYHTVLGLSKSALSLPSSGWGCVCAPQIHPRDTRVE